MNISERVRWRRHTRCSALIRPSCRPPQRRDFLRGEIRSFHSAKRVYFSPWVSALFATWAISLCKLYYNGLQTNYKSNIWFYTDSKWQIRGTFRRLFSRAKAEISSACAVIYSSLKEKAKCMHLRAARGKHRKTSNKNIWSNVFHREDIDQVSAFI